MVGDNTSGLVDTTCKVLVRNLLIDSLGGGIGPWSAEFSERPASFSRGGGGGGGNESRDSSLAIFGSWGRSDTIGAGIR